MNYDGKSSKMSNEEREIEIKPGQGLRTIVSFAKEGHEAYGHPNSDLIVKFKEISHECYRRKGDDLIYIHSVALLDALCSSPVHFSTLDGRNLQVPMDEVVSP
jgi:DnaJ-class molecular chaperone